MCENEDDGDLYGENSYCKKCGEICNPNHLSSGYFNKELNGLCDKCIELYYTPIS